LMVVLFIFIFIPLAQLPIKIAHYVILSLKGSIPLLATLVVYRMVDILGAYLAKLAERTEGKLDDQLVPIIRKTLKAFVVVIGGVVFLQNLNFNITALLAGISIGGLAIALAAQDTLKNFFGSVMIFLDRPFQIGDWITAGEIDGTVEEVGFRTTRVRTFRNSLVSVPNGKLSDMVVDNHGLRMYRRFYTQITITYDTPPEKVEAFVEGLRKIVELHPDTRKDYFNVFFNDLAAYSFNIMFYIFFQVPDWTNELRARHEVLLEVVKLAEVLDVRFAFPTQTLHMEEFPEKKSLIPQHTFTQEELKTKLEEFQKSK
jgi:MscS family membrane protein